MNMKKSFIAIILFLFSMHILCANVLDLFYPDVSYMECSQLSFKTIEGEFCFDTVPEISRATIPEKGNTYSFFEKGKHSSYVLDSSKNNVWLINNSQLYKGFIPSKSIVFIDYYPSEFEEDGSISNNYRVTEERDNRVVLESVNSQERFVIEYELFDIYARKIVYKNDKVLLCHWISSWREIEGIEIPRDECFFLSNLFYSGKILFKESKNISGIGLFYGPFTVEKLKEIIAMSNNN